MTHNVGKGKKTGCKTDKKKKKAAKKAARKKKKAASAARKLHKFMKQQAARAKQAKWQRLNPEAASLLGNPDGPLKGKRVRLIDPGLTEFLRNSPAQVLSHFTVTDTVTIRNHGGSVSTYPSSSVYLLTGRETAPLTEDATLRKLSNKFKADALTSAGGQLKNEKHKDKMKNE